MSFESAELKLRTLASAYAPLVTALTNTAPGGASVFCWFDRQLAQGDIGQPSQNKVCVTVQRVSSMDRTRFANQGGLVQNLSQPRLQINVVCYNAEKARQVADLIWQFMMTINLADQGEFSSPTTSPTQTPNQLLNQRAGMLFQLQPPAYTEIQDWRVWNNEATPQ